MNLTTLQKKSVLIASIVGSLSIITGSLYGVYSWINETIVTREYLDLKILEIRKIQDITFNELNLRLIDESLSRYYDKDITKLKGKELHRYNKLLIAERSNEARRAILLGL